MRAIFDRARVRGEVSPDVDVDLLASVVVEYVTHGGPVANDAAAASDSLIGFVDRVIVPAAFIQRPGGRRWRP